MPRGDKGAYSDKQERKAEHIEEGTKIVGLEQRGEGSRLGHGEQGIGWR